MLQNESQNSEVEGEERDNVNIIWLRLIRVQIILTKNSFFFPKPIVFFIFIAVISSYQIEKHNEIGVCFSVIDALLPER